MKATAFAAAIAFLCFATPRRLHGPFLYDDAAAIQRNPVVNGHVPLHAAMALDFWGEEMSSPRSHKSFRPLVTLSFRLSRVLQWESDGDSTFWFHLFNAGLHAFVTGMVPAFVNAAFGWRRGGRRAGAAAALLFALHPVHVEAVQNVVSRDGLMMAYFYLAQAHRPRCLRFEVWLKDIRRGPSAAPGGGSRDQYKQAAQMMLGGKAPPPSDVDRRRAEAGYYSLGRA